MSIDAHIDKTEPLRYRFAEFILDVTDRQLWKDGNRIELNARYFDALELLVRNNNTLVDKDRLFEEVWKDVVVSDSALSQCIKEIRKQLNDDASAPRFVQTVPRHGYRFIADVHILSSEEPSSPSSKPSELVSPTKSGYVFETEPFNSIWRKHLFEVGAGTLGGAIAGLFGGMLYGFGLASSQAELGTISTLLVLVSLTVLLSLMGGFGVSAGLAGGGITSHLKPEFRILFRIGGAALGGLVIGATVKLLGIDAFNLLTGRAPAGITGGPEGAALGAAIMLGAHLGKKVGRRSGKLTGWHSIWGAGLAGSVAGALIPLFGGHLLGGSLELLAISFTDSRIQLDSLASILGGVQFDLATEMTLGGVEGLLFGCFVVGAIHLTSRQKEDPSGLWEV